MQQLTAEDVKLFFANTQQITFEVTERCNLNCKYCGYGSLYNNKDPRHNNNLTTNDALALLRKIKELWSKGYDVSGPSVIHISFYGGEPLLNMSLIRQIIDYVESEMKTFSKDFQFSMTTNAVLLRKYIDYLVKKNFRLLISLDGDEYANSYRVDTREHPSFHKVIDNLDYIKTVYPNFFLNNVDFNSVITNRTTNSSTISYIQKRYGKTPSTSEINNVGINPLMLRTFQEMYQPKNDDLSIQEEHTPDSFKHAPKFENVAKYFQMYSEYFFSDYNELLYLSNTSKSKPPTGTCLPFTKKIFISAYGKIFPCERIGFTYSLGKIQNGVVELDYQNVADKYNSYYSRISPVCSKCSDYRGCLNCFFNTSQLVSPNAKCNYFVTPKEFQLMQEEIYDFVRTFPKSYEYIMTKYEII